MKMNQHQKKKEFILGFSNNQIQFTNKKKTEKKVYIIPLIDYTNPAPYIPKINPIKTDITPMEVDQGNENKIKKRN